MMKITSIASALLVAAPLVAAGFTDFYGLAADQKVSHVTRH
jgi:hypothetical protein